MRFGSGSRQRLSHECYSLTAVFALLGCLFLIAAVRRFRLRRTTGGLVAGTSALALFALAGCALLIGANLHTYQRLTTEQPAGELELSRVGGHQYSAILTYPSGESAVFYLRGDEWQIDARLLKWKAIANLAGFDTMYRLERISGRYSAIEDERNQPRTVYAEPSGQIDLWDVSSLSFVAPLVRCALRQRDLPAHGRQGQIRAHGFPKRSHRAPFESSGGTGGGQLAVTVRRISSSPRSGDRAPQFQLSASAFGSPASSGRSTSHT